MSTTFVTVLLVWASAALVSPSAERVDATSAGIAQTIPTSEHFAVQQVATGVFALIRKEPTGLMVDANTVFIINDRDVVVVDTNITPSSARASLTALRALTSKPVTYVINTHWHDDHVLGNQVYREAFPQAEFIAHEATREYLPAQGEINRKNMLSGAPAAADQLRNAVRDNKSFMGGPLTDSERAAYSSDVAQADRYVAEVPGVQVVLPTITVREELVLYRPGRTIEIKFLGRGHTHGDLVVHLPDTHVVIAGDLVVAPVPLIGADQSFVGDWPATLDALLALHAMIVIPGHGPIQRDDEYIKLFKRMLLAAKQQTDAAIARGETVDQARKSVTLEDYRKAMTGDDRELNLVFANYAASAAVGAIYREAKTKR